MAAPIAPDSDAIQDYHEQLQAMRAGDDTQHGGRPQHVSQGLFLRGSFVSESHP